jgi:hypothetical protein
MPKTNSFLFRVYNMGLQVQYGGAVQHIDAFNSNHVVVDGENPDD